MNPAVPVSKKAYGDSRSPMRPPTAHVTCAAARQDLGTYQEDGGGPELALGAERQCRQASTAISAAMGTAPVSIGARIRADRLLSGWKVEQAGRVRGYPGAGLLLSWCSQVLVAEPT